MQKAPPRVSSTSRWGFFTILLLGRAIIFLVETFNATSRVYHLLFTREKRMTGGADFYTVITKRGTRFNDVTASACDFGRFVIGMNTFLHLEPLL